MTRTALRFHVLTAISPPKLLISRRAPARTGTVVSVCCMSASAASVARVVSMLVYPPPSSARRRVPPLDPANSYLNLHLAHEMRRKLELLRQAATLAGARSQEEDTPACCRPRRRPQRSRA